MQTQIANRRWIAFTNILSLLRSDGNATIIDIFC
jgi:hypothetical protein